MEQTLGAGEVSEGGGHTTGQIFQRKKRVSENAQEPGGNRGSEKAPEGGNVSGKKRKLSLKGGRIGGARGSEEDGRREGEGGETAAETRGGDRERETAGGTAAGSSSGQLPRPPRYRPRPFVGVSQKSIFKRPCQVLAINANKMAPRPPQGLQDRPWNAPMKGLLWAQPLPGKFSISCGNTGDS